MDRRPLTTSTSPLRPFGTWQRQLDVGAEADPTLVRRPPVVCSSHVLDRRLLEELKPAMSSRRPVLDLEPGVGVHLVAGAAPRPDATRGSRSRNRCPATSARRRQGPRLNGHASATRRVQRTCRAARGGGQRIRIRSASGGGASRLSRTPKNPAQTGQRHPPHQHLDQHEHRRGVHRREQVGTGRPAQRGDPARRAAAPWFGRRGSAGRDHVQASTMPRCRRSATKSATFAVAVDSSNPVALDQCGDELALGAWLREELHSTRRLPFTFRYTEPSRSRTTTSSPATCHVRSCCRSRHCHRQLGPEDGASALLEIDVRYPRMNEPSLYVMTPREITLGFVFGSVAPAPAPVDRGTTAREALEAVVRQALLHPPCGIAFSGGRDSSAVLAVRDPDRAEGRAA